MLEELRILFVTPYFLPAQYFGGPVQAVYKLGRELVKRGHEVVVFTSDAKDLDSRLNVQFSQIDGMKVYYFRNLTMFFSRVSRLFITLELNKRLKLDLPSFDVVYTSEYTTFQNILVHKFARKYQIPYVIQARGSLPKIGRKARKWVYDALFGHRILRDSSAVIALTKAEVNQYRELGVPMDKIITIPNGIELTACSSLPPKGWFRKKAAILENNRIILYLGRIHKIKGIDILVKAYAHAKKNSSLGNAILVISGSDDGYLHELRSLVNSLNISHDVIFTGPLYGKDKIGAYQDSDVFVVPSYYEAFPNVILEAYSCSTPVIASNVQSISDIVLDHKTGLLFDVANVKDLSEVISYVLSHEKEAEDMGGMGRKLAEERFSIEKVVDSFEVIFEKLQKSR